VKPIRRGCDIGRHRVAGNERLPPPRRQLVDPGEVDVQQGLATVGKCIHLMKFTVGTDFGHRLSSAAQR